MTSEQKEKMIREMWFPKHIAVEKPFVSYTDILNNKSETIKVIDWREPNTGHFAVRYILDRNRLLVAGDIGEAIYIWSQFIGWDFLACCNMEYFVGKCQASEHGRSGQSWDSEHAHQRLKDLLWEETKQYLEAKGDIFAEGSADCREYHIKKYLKHLDLDIELYPTKEDLIDRSYTSSKGDWHSFLRDYGDELFGCDYGEYSNIGMQADIRCIGHWLGLEMAYEQLKGK